MRVSLAAADKEALSMKTIEQIKEGICHLFETDPNIHVSISMSHPKRSVKDRC